MNPVHETLIPEGRPSRETHAYDIGQITTLLTLSPELRELPSQ